MSSGSSAAWPSRRDWKWKCVMRRSENNRASLRRSVAVRGTALSVTSDIHATEDDEEGLLLLLPSPPSPSPPAFEEASTRRPLSS